MYLMKLMGKRIHTLHFSADATGAVTGVDATVAVATTAVLGVAFMVGEAAIIAFFTASNTLSSKL